MAKLLVVTTVPITIRAFLLPFVSHFRSLGWQVDAMAQGISEDADCVAACNRTFDIQWSRNVFDPRNLFSGISRVKEVVASGNYDLVHVHTPIAAFVTRYALKDFPQVKVIYTAHGFHFYRGGSTLKNLIFFSLEKMAGKWTDYLITINQEDYNAAQDNQFLDRERIYYTKGIGVDTSYYAAGRVSESKVTQIRHELHLAADNTLLLAIAEFTPRKRHQDMLSALAKTTDPQIHLALAGEGPLLTEIQKLASELGISERVHFLGFRRDIPTLIQAADAVLLVSQQEGLPRSIMEAMCLATPVIGTNIRGTQDLLGDGCGLLVNLGDTDALAKGMMQVSEEPEILANMAQQAQARIQDYDIKAIIEKYTGIYNLALAESQ